MPGNLQNSALRERLLHAMKGDESHIDFDAVISGFPVEQAGVKPPNAPHTAWQLLEHMRIAQRDILEFSLDPNYKSPEWPAGYWPASEAPPDAQAWHASVEAFRAEAKIMNNLILEPRHDLYAAIAGGQGQTLLREALVLGGHNSYHLGQLAFLKRMLLKK